MSHSLSKEPVFCVLEVVLEKDLDKKIVKPFGSKMKDWQYIGSAVYNTYLIPASLLFWFCRFLTSKIIKQTFPSISVCYHTWCTKNKSDVQGTENLGFLCSIFAINELPHTQSSGIMKTK